MGLGLGDDRLQHKKGISPVRTLLLAGTAILIAGPGLAQTDIPAPNPLQGQWIAKYGAGPALNNNNNAWGIANTPSGGDVAGRLSTIYAPNTVAVPGRGTVVIRLNGRIEVDLGTTFTNANSGVTSAGAPSGYKLNPVGVGSYLRLYPGFDGVAANGLRYGASSELRQNFPAGAAPAPNPSTYSSGETLYVRRAFVYVASDTAGLLRLGQGDGVLGLFDNCIFSSSCWDAGMGGLGGSSGFQAMAPSTVPITYVWLNGTGSEYSNAKAVYLSPQFYGVDIGVQYAPSMGNANTTCAVASTACDNATSGSDATRWYNQVGAGIRYQQLFGGVDVKAYAFYETAAKETLTTATAITPATARATGAGTTSLAYDNLSFYKVGAAITAMNITLAADYIGCLLYTSPSPRD